MGTRGGKIYTYSFYVIMIGMPLLGWAMVSASPIPIPTRIFDTVPWPNIPGIVRDEALADFFKMLHHNIAHFTMVLIALHVGAALKHQFVNKDGLLSRMFPGS